MASASLCPWWPSHPVSRIVSPLTFSPPRFSLLPRLCAWRHKPCVGRKPNDSSAFGAALDSLEKVHVLMTATVL